MASGPQRCWRIVHSESSTGWGGQEHRILAELAGFRQRGCQVWLFAPPEAQIGQKATGLKLSVVPLRMGKLHFPFAVGRAARCLRELGAEVVNTHSSRDGWIVGLAGRWARTPLLIRTRHIDVDYPHRWLSGHAYTRLADHVLTTSERITRHFQAMFNLPSDRLTTVPTGIDLQRFSPDGPAADLPADPGLAALPVVGMVSVLRSWKGHDTFLQAARLLQDTGFPARYVIVGEGPVRPLIEAQAARLQLTGVLTMLGHREDVPALLRALSVLVIASTQHEGVPQIGLQALATRTPVVGSDCGGTPEIIRPGETGRLFPAGNAAALAAAIRETLEQREATQALRERGRARVEVQHSLEAMLEQLEGLYRRYLPVGSRTFGSGGANRPSQATPGTRAGNA